MRRNKKYTCIIFFVVLLLTNPAQPLFKEHLYSGDTSLGPEGVPWIKVPLDLQSHTVYLPASLKRDQKDPTARRVTHFSRDFAAMFILSRSDATHALTTVESIEFSNLYVYSTLKHFTKEAFAQVPHVLHVIQWVLPQFIWIIQSKKP